jgi:N-acetylmuramoyl-L-alanine amidase
LKEKDVTLDLSRRLERALEREGNYEVRLTREGDSSLSLKARTGIANNFNADLFISIHLNAVPTQNARGSETYYLSLDDDNSFDVSHYNTGDSEEDSTEEESDDLELILWDMAQAKHLDDSFRIAKYIQDEFNTLAGIRSRGVKQAPMKVLKGAQMPAVLVEVAFLTDPVEERKLKGAAFREKIIRSLVNAILTYDREVQLRSKGALENEKAGH